MKKIIWSLNILLLIGLLGLGYTIMNVLKAESPDILINDLTQKETPNPGSDQPSATFSDYQALWTTGVSSPTNTSSGAPTRTGDLVLTGTIIESGKEPVAFIFNSASRQEDTYHIGDSLGNWQVKKISRNEVILRNANGQQKILKAK